MCFYPRVCVKVLYNLLVRLRGICCNYLACVCRYKLPSDPDCSSTSSSSPPSTSGSSNKEHIELNDNVYDYVVISEYCSVVFILYGDIVYLSFVQMSQTSIGLFLLEKFGRLNKTWKAFLFLFLDLFNVYIICSLLIAF